MKDWASGARAPLPQPLGAVIDYRRRILNILQGGLGSTKTQLSLHPKPLKPQAPNPYLKEP